MHTAAYMLMLPPHYHATAPCLTLRTEAKFPNLTCQAEAEPNQSKFTKVKRSQDENRTQN